MAISKQAIVQASIKILNRDGIDNLTMRTIANELQIKAASLYWHVRGKSELYSEIAEYLCSQYQMPKREVDEKSFLEDMYRSYRTMLLSTRDAVPVFEDSIPNTPRRMELITATIDALSVMGIPDKNLITIGNLLNNYVLSFVADEVRFKNTSPEAFADFAETLGPFDRRMFANIDYDGQFLYGLRVLFAGLESPEAQK
ncbi:TetR/AcrR family transcriptional regulator C-terminal domain-containing protein [Alicyclobacillus sp. SO9]|uniref:TetR/AcrR family transcriptional regulator C-terminal domain-containing protein n=1 Tax=Alicyclobacillus sp. SO9 TaxID=2665646 RepID=UPI0018E6F17B|nr:TetR/AcrR family transcriptional regulator C-terminal domain-containing protein [Alicyclobacillus sp. SO9]QQE78697.1 TetR/AcrR family transcriptional regulator C-terminal domain-containing protein [Alicyclobacillus sp. SO9]